uniref:F-box domain-containing protein n=1 Tax=Oryza glumipatula TaxID=40148 RepID=A0A0D9ZHH6_9ORYZ
MGEPHAGEDRGDDYLGTLPDCLLHKVMSFLPARQAVQTCVLSRRWRDLWRSMPCIDIDDDDFVGGASTATTGQLSRKVRWRQLMDFASNLLEFHDVHVIDFKPPFLERFRLHLAHSWTAPYIRAWKGTRLVECCILGGFRHRPAAADIAVGVGVPLFRLPWLPSVSTSRLKRLHLSGLVLDGCFGECICSSCPVLEAMELKSCSCEFNKIESATLKSLAIHGCRSCFLEGTTLAIKTPRLTSLLLRITVYYELRVRLVDRMDYLIEASIREKSYEPINFDNDLCKSLGALASVRNLKLSWSRSMDSPHGEFPNFPTFQKLTTLHLYKCNMCLNLNILLSFLQKAPSLERVILQNCKFPVAPRKRKRSTKVDRHKIPPECKGLITSESRASKHIEITYQDDDFCNLIKLFSCNWRKLEEYTITLTKV